MSFLAFEISNNQDFPIDAFSAVFLNQESYRYLLDLVDIYFDLGIRNEDSELPCLIRSYMLISTNHNKLHVGLNKKVSLKVDKLIYIQKYNIVVASVFLKNNFTCRKIPHIIITKRTDMSAQVVDRILNDEISGDECDVKTLHAPYTVKGRIGVLCNSEEELSYDNRTEVRDGLTINYTGKRVFRPEVTHSVENTPPPPKKESKFITFEQFKNDSSESGSKDLGFYQGCQVKKGPRGGKYIVKDGKKVYINEKSDKSIEKSSGVVYSVNLLDES